MRLDKGMRFRLMLVSLATLLVIEPPATVSARQPSTDSLRKDVDALLAGMVAAFKRDPAAVGAFYTDAAAIVGGGQRFQGRASVDNYWKGTTGFADWSLDTLETGGHADAPWAYGRSVLLSKSGQKMETYFVGLLRRAPSGDLKFQVDAFTRQRGDDSGDDASRAFATYLTAVEKADANALRSLLDDQFVIISSTVRNKAEEIADLVPQSGSTVEYFRSDETRTRGFGSLAVTTGVLKWTFNGRELQRNHSTIAVKRGAEWKILAQQVTPRG
jgi:ketosteroid isomerase-like protein